MLPHPVSERLQKHPEGLEKTNAVLFSGPCVGSCPLLLCSERPRNSQHTRKKGIIQGMLPYPVWEGLQKHLAGLEKTRLLHGLLSALSLHPAWEARQLQAHMQESIFGCSPTLAPKAPGIFSCLEWALACSFFALRCPEASRPSAHAKKARRHPLSPKAPCRVGTKTSASMRVFWPLVGSCLRLPGGGAEHTQEGPESIA